MNVLIVDDERPARQRLRAQLEELGSVTIVGECDDGESAVRHALELRPDLMFLDVQMPGMDGLEVVQCLRGPDLPRTIFTTAHRDHAVEAFALPVLDYLLKPYSLDRLRQALDRAEKRQSDAAVCPAEAPPAAGGTNAPVERFLVKANRRYHIVPADQIIAVEAAANYIIMRTTNGRHVLRRTLQQIETELDPARFFRASRSAIVSLPHVTEVKCGPHQTRNIILSDGHQIPLTRRLRELQTSLAALD